jgi:hypothetical protein
VAPKLGNHVRYANRASRRLARALFHAMVKNGPKLEREQVLLGKLVDIGTDLFAISATCAYARGEQIDVADYFCAEARIRIDNNFRALTRNNNQKGYKLARKILDS